MKLKLTYAATVLGIIAIIAICVWATLDAKNYAHDEERPPLPTLAESASAGVTNELPSEMTPTPPLAALSATPTEIPPIVESSPTPTAKPEVPLITPTKRPTSTPTPEPVITPTPKMTTSIIPNPPQTSSPTPTPAKRPTSTPTPEPVITPTPKMTTSIIPTPPASAPTEAPTNVPSPTPTKAPTNTPMPTNVPSPTPTKAPTNTPTPELAKGDVFQTVEELRAADKLTEGMQVSTLGYYEKGDGGASKYEVVKGTQKDDGGRYLKLANQLVARLIVEGDTVSVSQFGAKGDGVADDAAAIQSAFSSGARTVTLKNRAEYKCSQSLLVGGGDLRVVGNHATLFTDNDYTDKKEFFFNIRSNHVVVEDMTIEARETVETGYKTQLCVYDASDVQLLRCKFITQILLRR